MIDARVRNLKKLIECHHNEEGESVDLPAASMVLVNNGSDVLKDDDKLSEKGVTEGSVVCCLVRRPPESAPCHVRRWWKMARRLLRRLREAG